MAVHIRVEIVAGDDRALITTDVPVPVAPTVETFDACGTVEPSVLEVLGFDDIRAAGELAMARALAGVGIDGGPVAETVTDLDEQEQPEGPLDDVLAVLGVTRSDMRTSVLEGGIRLDFGHDGSTAIARVDLHRPLTSDETNALVAAMRNLPGGRGPCWATLR